MTCLKKIQEAIYSLELTGKEASILRAFTGKATGGGPGFRLACNIHSAIAREEVEPDRTNLFQGHFDEEKK